VRAVVHLGQTLGLDTVAEGIESAAQASALRAFGCDYGQGYHFARPLEPGRIPAELARDATRVGA
jgi:EAL domain-containing protein (putative c-di-GMP-specific phosphodiesterase class I)